MKSNSKLLNNWLYKTIIDHPEIVKESKDSKDVYSHLYLYWLEDIQEAMKAIAKEILDEKS